MTVTYPHDRPTPQYASTEDVREEPFVPVYARNRRGVRSRKGGVKAWMILTPLAVLVLGAAAAALVMGDRDGPTPAPLAEPAATAPVLPTQPLLTNPAPVEAVPVAAPAPVVRRAAPAPARRVAAPVRAATPAPAPEPRVVVPAEPTSPQPYTATLNAAPAPAQAPVIVIQPAD